jgi:hypothetical protein
MRLDDGERRREREYGEDDTMKRGCADGGHRGCGLSRGAGDFTPRPKRAGAPRGRRRRRPADPSNAAASYLRPPDCPAPAAPRAANNVPVDPRQEAAMHVRPKPFFFERRAAAAALGASLLLAACAAPRPDAVWNAPDVAAQAGLLRGANVIVACEAPDVAVRNVCQDRLAQEVTTRGARPVFVPPDTQLVANRPLDEQLLQSARAANAAAVVVLSLRPIPVDEGSPFSISLGGFGFGHSSAIGGGVSAPLGESRLATAYSGNGRVTRVATGRLVWSATATSQPVDDLPRQLSTLSASVLDSAARSGLF